MIIDLVDSIEYTTTNGFTHQLHKALSDSVVTVPLAKINDHPNPTAIISRLKQRTLFRTISELKAWAGRAPFVVFDQDPWHSFMVDSPYKGTYDMAMNELNVRSFAVTARWWSEFMIEKGYPTKFTPMGLLPEYCSSKPTFSSRQIETGFIGQMHPYRKELFDVLEKEGAKPQVLPSGNYQHFLTSLSRIKVFIHAEKLEFVLDDRITNLDVGPWVKDVEAIGRGCFSIRNRGHDHGSYELDNCGTLFLYDDPIEVFEIVEFINLMDPNKRQKLLDDAVDFVKESNFWKRSASILLETIDGV